MRYLSVNCAKCGTSNFLCIEGVLSPDEALHCSRCRERLGKVGALDGAAQADFQEQEEERAIAC